MEYFFLIITILTSSLKSSVDKMYTQKSGNGETFIYSGLLSLFAMLFFAVTSGGMSFTTDFLGYSVLFALSYAAATVCTVLALQYGSVVLTSLVLSFSLMLPAIYGIIFLHEATSIWLYLGLLFLSVSLFLINFKSEKNNTISPKWLLFVTIAFLGNGMCSISQKMQQVSFEGQYKNEFMICALFIVSATLLAIGALRNNKKVLSTVKIGWYFALISGLFNGITNLLVMVLGNKIPASLLFPLISAGGIVINYIVSRFYFKEKITPMQTVGIAVGIVAIVFFNL